jgi:hypothetical protein
MTEQEWLSCEYLSSMWGELNLRHNRLVTGNNGKRKLRLFAAACCRRIWDLFPEDRCRRAVEVCERSAEGRAATGELVAARQALAGAERGKKLPPKAALAAVAREAWLGAQEAAVWAALAARDALQGRDGPREEDYQCALLREIFGNPFRPVKLAGAWLRWQGGTVARLARTIYKERRFADLPILADALEEAGCASAELLGHCRGGGEHVRGCWAVDLLLGKS